MIEKILLGGDTRSYGDRATFCSRSTYKTELATSIVGKPMLFEAINFGIVEALSRHSQHCSYSMWLFFVVFSMHIHVPNRCD